MCEALDEIIEFHSRKRIEAGRLEGRLEGQLDTLLSLVRDGLLSLTEAAKRAGMTEEKMQEMLGNG